MCKSILNWEDKVFWDSSLRFIVRQLDLYIEHNKVKKSNDNSEVKEYKIIQYDDW